MKRSLPFVALLLSFQASAADAPAYVIELPDTVSSVFVADTGAASMYRFDASETGLDIAHQGYLSIGENGAGKSRAWDGKTPLGIYFVVDELDVSRLHEKYGVAAYPLDYPNTWDRLQDKTGDGIWLHGVVSDIEQRPAWDTDGCLALPNADLRAQAGSIVALVTPVIVTPAMDWQTSENLAALRDELRAVLAQWAGAQTSHDLPAYVSFYARDFSYRGMLYDEWLAYRAQTIGRRENLKVDVSDVMLLMDPVEDELYLSRFRHTVTDGDKATVTTKRLYWRRQDSGELKIVAEDNG